MKYSLTSDTWDTREIKAINKVIKSKVYTYRGEYVKKFEKRFANFFGTKYSVFVNSGSSANLLAFFALINPKNKYKLQKNDECLIPSLCWSTSLWPIIQAGLKPKFVDVDVETLNINLKEKVYHEIGRVKKTFRYKEKPLVAKATIMRNGIKNIKLWSFSIKSFFIAGSKSQAIDDVLPATIIEKKAANKMLTRCLLV